MKIPLVHVCIVGAVLLGMFPCICAQQQLRHEVEPEGDERALTRARIVGNNGRGPFPLGLCQGDCDSDKECSGKLVCSQRNRGDSVPGCWLGSLIRTKNDVCVKDPDRDDDDDDDDADDDDIGGGQISSHFALKLYWEKGYFWQVRRNLYICLGSLSFFDYSLTMPFT